MKRLGAVISAVIVSLGFGAPAFATAQPDTQQHAMHDGVCVQVPVHVALAKGEPAKGYVSGTFCYPFKKTSAIDILVHGASYDRSYWDSGFDFPDYSYVNRTLGAGRAVFYYDRLGVGKSSPLPSTSVTMYADAYVLHQLIQRFKPVFHTIDVIGHSYGSRISSLEASEFNDATRLVLTDNLHAVGPAIANNVIKQYPANQDPLFQGQNLDDGWMTTQPDVRGAFYYLPGADQDEIDYDNAHKSFVSATEFQQGQTIGRVPAGQNVSNSITRPILLILGQEDSLYCGLALDCSAAANVKSFEAPYYTNAASLTVDVVPNTGHDLALHKSAQTSFDMINAWLQ